jgi:pimeloyl-ACP methyl ester carboxylesterase
MDSLVAPRESNLSLGSMTLHVATWGQPEPDRPAVLMVHGLTVNHREFLEVGPALAATGYYVIAPDLRGRGLSEKPAHGYSISIHAHDLLALLDALNVPQVHIVGHSLGAIIAQYVAALYPQRVGKIVMIDAGGKIPDDTAQAIAASVGRLGVVYPSLDAYMGLLRQLPVVKWNPFWEQNFQYDAEVHPDGTVTSRVPKSAIEEESVAMYFTRTEALPAAVRAPALVLRAAQGTLAPDRGFVLPAEEAERLRQVMPDCRVIEIPETNHYTIIEAPQLRDAIREFLGSAH